MWAAVSFSTPMPVEYNPVLLVVNYVAKILWYRKYFLHKEIYIKIFFIHWQYCTPQSRIEQGVPISRGRGELEND